MLTSESQAIAHKSIQERGFCILPQAMNHKTWQILSDSYALLMKESLEILSRVSQSDQSLSEYYKAGGEKLIVVPENGDSDKICRFEYISNHSEEIRDSVIPYFQEILSEITGSRFKLFKDKCNVKRPGGGAFGCHQDYPAYSDFIPDYHLTIAIFLDQPSISNGCLEMAKNWKSISDNLGALDSDYPGKSIFKRNPDSGDVLPEIADKFEWERILPAVNDIVLFDSFVPHRSSVNASDGSRRAYFFTFAPESSGDHYAHYYRVKRNAFDNPKFHLSTPTDRGV